MEITIDFDGTCVTHDYPEVGRDIGAIPVLQELVSQGHKLILWTMRSDNRADGSNPLSEAVDWFKQNDIPLYGVNSNPTQKSWTGSPKAYAQLYIDDAALGIPLRRSSKEPRPYVDWSAVGVMLKDRGILV